MQCSKEQSFDFTDPFDYVYIVLWIAGSERKAFGLLYSFTYCTI